VLDLPYFGREKGLKKTEFSLSMAWRHIGGVEVWLHSFLTSVQDGGEW